MNRRMRETDKQPRHVRSSKHDAISNGNPRLPPNSGPSIVPSGYFWISGLLAINFHQPRWGLVKIPAEGGTIEISGHGCSGSSVLTGDLLVLISGSSPLVQTSLKDVEC